MELRRNRQAFMRRYPTNNKQVEALFHVASERFGRPADALVNNGGGQFPGAAESFTSKGCANEFIPASPFPRLYFCTLFYPCLLR